MGKKRNSQRESKVLEISGRVDAFNYQATRDKIEAHVEACPGSIALDLTRVNFLSLSIIKYFGDVARNLKMEGRELILLGLTEKLKRQVDLYASLEGMMVYRNAGDWKVQNHTQPIS